MYYTFSDDHSWSKVIMSLKKNRENFEGLSFYYEKIIASLPNLLYILDRNCTFIAANTNFLQLIGFSKQKDISGKTYKEIAEHFPWSKERVQLAKRKDIAALLSEEAIESVEEMPVVDSTGEISYYLVSRIPLLGKKQDIEGLLVVLTDITEQKRLKEELGKVKEQLQQLNAKPLASEKSSGLISKDNKIPKILMVEDNTIAQKATQSLLMQLDCHVDIAESEEKALSLFKPGKYDLVFMDIGLEGTSGYVVSKQVRKMEQGTDFRVPIIALTGFEADVVKYDCVDYFMEGALTKPLTSEQAKQIIQHYIYDIDIPIRGLRSTKGS
jgi:PAS domain S-box-containing protein